MCTVDKVVCNFEPCMNSGWSLYQTWEHWQCEDGSEWDEFVICGC